MRFSSHLFPCLLAGTVVLSAPAAALSQSKEGRAQTLQQEAMNNDYLALDFPAAEKKLTDALKLCGKKDCSAATRAGIHISLGIVLGGQDKLDQAKASFITGLEIDPTAQLDEDLATPELKLAFDQARNEVLGELEIEEEVVLEEIAHTPPAEQAIHTPLPIFLMVPESLDANRVQLRYRAPGADDYKSMMLSELDTGYGGNIPCRDLREEGVLVYYVQVLDATGAVVMTAGTLAQPYRVRIREELAGDPPHLPGQAPPEACIKPKPKVAPPPEDETIYPPCDSNRDCAEGMYCSSKHRCEEGFDEDEDGDAFSRAKKSWITVSFAADIAHTSGTDVCTLDSQQNDFFACYRANGEAYRGDPILGRADDIQPGFAVATMRALVGYDHLVHPNVTIGGRLGYAFNGSPDGFLPIHADARVTYYIGSDPFSRAGVRPFVFLVGGLMQVDTKVAVEVWEQDVEGCTRPSGCKTDLDAWRQAGNVFAGLGLGAQYAVTPAHALVLSARGEMLFPASSFVITPEIGFATGF